MHTILTKISKVGLVFTLLIPFAITTPVIAGTYAVIGNVNNKVDKSDARKEVRRLYLKIRDSWSNGITGKAFDRAETTTEHAAFRDIILGMKKDRLSNHWLSIKQKTGETPPRVISSPRTLVRMISKYEGGFGVINDKDTKNLPDNVRVLFTFDY